MPSIHSARRTKPSPFFARGVMHSVLNSSQQSSSLGDIFAALTVQHMPLRALSVEQALYVAQLWSYRNADTLPSAGMMR